MKKNKIKYITELTKKQLKDKACLVRLDLNVLSKDISKSERIKQSIETIKYLSKNGAKIVIIGHRGRPDLNKLKNKKYRENFSLGKASRYISRKLAKKILFIDKFNPKEIKTNVEALKGGGIIMLENVRFIKGEISKSINLAKKYASFADIYINDAFSVSHRDDVTVSIIPDFLPSYGGPHLKIEIDKLSNVIKNPKKSLVLIVGGAKVSDKSTIIKSFIGKAKAVLLGGGIANTYFASKNIPIGDSLYEKSSIKTIKKWSDKGNIYIPDDVVIKDKKILDIGYKTIEKYTDIILSAKTIIWNGPMGLIENKKFSHGTYKIAESIIKSKAYSVVGGGETTSFIYKNRMASKFSFLSSGGGAMLQFLSEGKMPGISALVNSKN